MPDERADFLHMKELSINSATRGAVLTFDELQPIWQKNRPQAEERILSFKEAVAELKKG